MSTQFVDTTRASDLRFPLEIGKTSPVLVAVIDRALANPPSYRICLDVNSAQHLTQHLAKPTRYNAAGRDRSNLREETGAADCRRKSTTITSLHRELAGVPTLKLAYKPQALRQRFTEDAEGVSLRRRNVGVEASAYFVSNTRRRQPGEGSPPQVIVDIPQVIIRARPELDNR